MRKHAWRAVRTMMIGGAVILALAPLVPICSFMYLLSLSVDPSDQA